MKYRGAAYWENETPAVVETAKLRFSHYEKAGRLQVSILFKNKETGEKRGGKTTTLDEEDLRLHQETLGFVIGVLENWREVVNPCLKN